VPTGAEALRDETGAEEDAYQKAIAMETVAMDDGVPNGDVQHEETTENTMSHAAGQVSAEEGDHSASQVTDAAGDQEAATEATGERADNELPESEITLRRQSIDGSTERPAAYTQSPEPGNLLMLSAIWESAQFAKCAARFG